MKNSPLTEGSILRLEDQKRRLLLSIDGRKAQLDALERRSAKPSRKRPTDSGAELTIPDVSAAIAEMGDEGSGRMNRRLPHRNASLIR